MCFSTDGVKDHVYIADQFIESFGLIIYRLFGAQASDEVEAVMIGGVWKKRNGKLLVDGLEAKKQHLAQSGQRLVRDIERQGHAA